MSNLIEVKVPDIGDYKNIPVIEVYVKAGDSVAVEDTLVTLESDKATLDVPSSHAGVVKEVKVAVGDKISEGSVVVMLESTAAAAATTDAAPAPAPTPTAEAAAPAPAAPVVQEQSAEAKPAVATPAVTNADSAPAYPAQPLSKNTYASPSVRHFARELDVNLDNVAGTGPKNRITHEDVRAYIKAVMNGAAACPTTNVAQSSASLGGGLDLLPWPQIDFTKFGEIDVQPLSRIKKISGQNLSRNWVMIPHVTVNDEADMTDLER